MIIQTIHLYLREKYFLFSHCCGVFLGGGMEKSIDITGIESESLENVFSPPRVCINMPSEFYDWSGESEGSETNHNTHSACLYGSWWRWKHISQTFRLNSAGIICPTFGISGALEPSRRR